MMIKLPFTDSAFFVGRCQKNAYFILTLRYSLHSVLNTFLLSRAGEMDPITKQSLKAISKMVFSRLFS